MKKIQGKKIRFYLERNFSINVIINTYNKNISYITYILLDDTNNDKNVAELLTSVNMAYSSVINPITLMN